MGNRFPTTVSSKTKEKEALLVWGKLECIDPTKETTIVYEFLLTVDSLENRLQKATPVSPYWELHVVEENDPKECLHMNTEWHIVSGETSKCTMVCWNAQYVCGAIALGYIVIVVPTVGNRFPTKVSSKTNEKEALFVSRKLECNDPTKETTIVCDFLLKVESLENRLQKVTPVSPYWELHVVEENDPTSVSTSTVSDR